MEVVRSRHRPRCADCGSSAIILQGESVWQYALEVAISISLLFLLGEK